MNNQKEIVLAMLDSENPAEEQARGLELAKNEKNIRLFLQPGFPFGVGTWENCAIAISVRSDEEINEVICDLFKWLQDMNWPGAETIYKRLLIIPPQRKDLKDSLINCLKESSYNKDYVWRKTLKDFYYDYCKNHSLNPDTFIDKAILVNKIEEILQMLDMCNHPDVQQKGIELAANIDVELLLQYEDGYVNQNIWRNCAIVLSNKTDNELKPFLFYLLYWLKDPSSPGSDIILTRLNKYEDKNGLENMLDSMQRAEFRSDNVSGEDRIKELRCMLGLK